jgi:hypothetical protein
LTRSPDYAQAFFVCSFLAELIFNMPGLNVTDEEKQELMVTFAALILHDDKAPVTAENMNKLITAAGGKVEPYWPTLFGTARTFTSNMCHLKSIQDTHTHRHAHLQH